VGDAQIGSGGWEFLGGMRRGGAGRGGGIIIMSS